jgi:hypothetical protein
MFDAVASRIAAGSGVVGAEARPSASGPTALPVPSAGAAE